jgi:serine/threonine-protein kinase
VRPGEVFADKYRVDRVIGRGGMGLVVAAHHLQLDEPVALKLLLPEATESPEAVARFLREARAAVKIKSEHVVRVSDVGTLPDGAPYMVMEYLEGADLAARLAEHGPLPVEQAVEFVLQTCLAVADAHALGIVHRDLKPANLFCVRRSDGQLAIKVLDFGISKVTASGGQGSAVEITRTASLMGTPVYMSPEQMRSSRDVDGTTDIWALGVILFELLVGRPVFLAQSVTELAAKVVSDPAPPLRQFRPEAPAGLEAVIHACLEKDRRMRYPNVGELSRALLPWAPRRALSVVERTLAIVKSAGLSATGVAEPPSWPVAGTQSAPTRTMPAFGTTLSESQRRRSIWIAGVFLGGVVALGAVLTTLRGRGPFRATTAVQVAGPTAAGSEPPVVAVSGSEPPVVAVSELPLAPPPSPGGTADAAPASSSAVRAAPTASPYRPVAGPGVPASPPVAMAPPTAAKGAVPAPAPPPATKAQPGCDPPFYFDGEGNRLFKKACL